MLCIFIQKKPFDSLQFGKIGVIWSIFIIQELKFFKIAELFFGQFSLVRDNLRGLRGNKSTKIRPRGCRVNPIEFSVRCIFFIFANAAIIKNKIKIEVENNYIPPDTEKLWLGEGNPLDWYRMSHRYWANFWT